jgi:hypothetical protein
MGAPKTPREVLEGLLEQISKAMSSDGATCEKAEVRALDLHAENLGLLNQCRSEYGLSEGVEREFKYIEYWAALDPETRKEAPSGYYFLSLKSEGWLWQLDSWIRKCSEAAAGESRSRDALPDAAPGAPFYKPSYFKQWYIGDDLLRRNATNGKKYVEGKVRRVKKAPARGKGKRGVYWYSEPDTRKRWPEKFKIAEDELARKTGNPPTA